MLNKVLANPSPAELEWFAREGEKSVWPYLAIIRSHLRIELALHKATRDMRERMSTPRASPVLPELPLTQSMEASTTSLQASLLRHDSGTRDLPSPHLLDATRRSTASAGASPRLSRQPSIGHDGIPTSPDSIPPRRRSPPPVSPPLGGRKWIQGDLQSSPSTRKSRSGSMGSLNSYPGASLNASSPAYRRPSSVVKESEVSPPEPSRHIYSRRLSSSEAQHDKKMSSLGAFMSVEAVTSPGARSDPGQ